MQHETLVGIDAHNSYGAQRWVGGALSQSDETVAEEVPVALVYNGISHAVMLATPLDLEDFALGFSLSECIVRRAGEVNDLEIIERDNGIEVHMELCGERAHALKQHRRTLAGRTGCGLCGTESLDQLAQRAATVQSSLALTAGALPRALSIAGYAAVVSSDGRRACGRLV